MSCDLYVQGHALKFQHLFFSGVFELKDSKNLFKKSLLYFQ